MATKTFKIGLSSEDKQNMAQNILEQVEALLFEEYDSTKTYNTNDYVVYDGALYRCLDDNTTGTWDNTKWTTATLQDLVDDVNSAVASVSGKADIVSLENGTLVPAKSLTAEQLENVSENSGNAQDKPFTFQATATDGGTGASDTAPIAKYIKLKGQTYAFNQQLAISSATTQEKNGITFTNNSDGTWSISGTATDNTYLFLNELPFIANHKYLLKGCPIGGSASSYFLCAYYNADFKDKDIGSGIMFNTTSTLTGRVAIRILNGTAITGTIKFYPQLIDLTQLFNGDIPPAILNGVELSDYDLTFTGVDIFNQMFPLPYYAYNTGTLVSANATTLKTTGKNQFDYSNPTNYIPVINSQKYIVKNANGGILTEYDGAKNEIGTTSIDSADKVVVLSSNTHYVKISNYSATTCLFLAWLEDGTTSRPDYEEYVSHTYDLGSELKTSPLLSAGDITEEKLPNGTITRKVGSVDLSTLSWSLYSTGVYVATLSGMKLVSGASIVGNILHNKYVRTSIANLFSNDKVIACGNNESTIYIKDTSLTQTSDITGTLYYELATYTHEDGTSYTENIEVDDFGTMEYGGTDYNGYPQGCEIFYPADYVLFIDSLGNATDFNASNVITKDNVATSFENYLKSLTGYNGSKTQTLKNVEGTLAWVDDE